MRIGLSPAIQPRAAEGQIFDQAEVAIRGDALDPGSVNIFQVVRLTQAVSGDASVIGPYMEAPDLTDSETVDIADLTALSELLRTAMREQQAAFRNGKTDLA